MLQPFRNYAERERLYASDGFITVLAIGHNARQSGYLGEPTAVVFALDFNRERHTGQSTIGPAVQQGAAMKLRMMSAGNSMLARLFAARLGASRRVSVS